MVLRCLLQTKVLAHTGKAYRLLWLTDLVNFGRWGLDVDAVRFVVKFELFLQ